MSKEILTEKVKRPRSRFMHRSTENTTLECRWCGATFPDKQSTKAHGIKSCLKHKLGFSEKHPDHPHSRTRDYPQRHNLNPPNNYPQHLEKKF